jgi:hypothetical protein
LQFIRQPHVAPAVLPCLAASEWQPRHVPWRQHLVYPSRICAVATNIPTNSTKHAARVPASMPHCWLLKCGALILPIRAVLASVPESPICVGRDIYVPVTVVSASCMHMHTGRNTCTPFEPDQQASNLVR